MHRCHRGDARYCQITIPYLTLTVTLCSSLPFVSLYQINSFSRCGRYLRHTSGHLNRPRWCRHYTTRAYFSDCQSSFGADSVHYVDPFPDISWGIFNDDIWSLKGFTKTQMARGITATVARYRYTTPFIQYIHKGNWWKDEYVYKNSNLCASDVASQAAHTETTNRIHYCKSSIWNSKVGGVDTKKLSSKSDFTM